MYDERAGSGLQILANPCNQFGAQEPWEESKIKDWVTSTYGVTFPLLSKVDVKGDGASDLYKYMNEQAADADIKWNFAKFLVNSSGQVVKFYAHGVDPNDMLADIDALLNQ